MMYAYGLDYIVDEELSADEAMRYDEKCRLEEIYKAMMKTLCKIEDSESESSKEYGITGIYDMLTNKLYDLAKYVEGRMQELDRDYSVHEAGECAGLRKAAEAARAYEINYIALRGLSMKEYYDALEWIYQSGLASMNYEKTCEAINKYRRKG